MNHIYINNSIIKFQTCTIQHLKTFSNGVGQKRKCRKDIDKPYTHTHNQTNREQYNYQLSTNYLPPKKLLKEIHTVS